MEYWSTTREHLWSGSTYQQYEGEYISCNALTVGDYGGSGSMGEANIRCLESETPDEDYFIFHGSHGHKQLWLKDTPEHRELVEGLERDYPVLDDEEMCRVELEWESEAWDGWVKNDLLKGLPDELREVIEDDLDNDVLFTLYRESMEATNTYPTPEYSGVHVDIDRIQKTFNNLVLEKFAKL